LDVRHRTPRAAYPGLWLSEKPENEQPPAQYCALSLLGLAPGGGYLAVCIAASAGGLLHIAQVACAAFSPLPASHRDA